MKGYYGQPEATEKVIRGGWLFTGDLGFEDEDGLFYFVKSRKEIINYGGQKIYPGQLERYFRMHPNVVSAKIYGKDDVLLGQRAEADVCFKEKTDTSMDELHSWLKQNITPYKIPRKITSDYH
jgi:long-chain acyl-CoA synthetase